MEIIKFCSGIIMDRLLRIFCLCGLLLSTAVCKADASDLEIMSDHIGADGIVSAYESYVFCVSTANGNVSDPQWSYCLYGRDGKAVEVKTADSMSFEIDSIADPEAYQITGGSDLTGFVRFRCLVDGVEREANPFMLTLSLKPVINSISDVQVIKEQYSKTLLCNVSYTGAEYVCVEVEEDYASAIMTYFYKEPFIAHLCIENIALYYNAWVDIKVANKYGLVKETIEIDPDFYTKDNSAGIGQIFDTIVSVQAFDMQGRFLGAFDSVDQAKTELARGLYIFKIFENRKESRVLKVAL